MAAMQRPIEVYSLAFIPKRLFLVTATMDLRCAQLLERANAGCGRQRLRIRSDRKEPAFEHSAEGPHQGRNFPQGDAYGPHIQALAQICTLHSRRGLRGADFAGVCLAGRSGAFTQCTPDACALVERLLPAAFRLCCAAHTGSSASA